LTTKFELLTFARWCHFVWRTSYSYKCGINRCVQNKVAMKCAKNHGNWFRRFEDVSRRCEPSNVVAPFFGPPYRPKHYGMLGTSEAAI